MNLEPVDLLMVQSETADDRVRVEKFLPCGAQPCVGGERLIRLEPSSDRPLRHLKVCPLAEDSLRICQRVAEVERGNSVKNGLEGVGFTLARFGGESDQAFCALKYLQRPQPIASLSFPDCVLRSALRAMRIFLLG